MAITGKDLIDLGFPPGAALGRALAFAKAHGLEGAALAAYVDRVKPAPVVQHNLLDAPVAYHRNIEAETEDEVANVAAVTASMDRLMRTPTLVDGAVMPDACPAGPEGTIPVGGVAVAQNAIHPGMHSADICCSVMLTEFDRAAPAEVLDAVHQTTHFGPGPREAARAFDLPREMAEAFRANAFLRDPKLLAMADSHLGTQGDGNHFAFVGRSEATGRTCLVTHHGSRGPGAALYKLGMKAAEAHRRRYAPAVMKQNAWLEADSDEGRAYWDALQLIRAWTKLNHTLIHDATAAQVAGHVRDRFWNEHNFVFRKGDLYYHAKGATPVDDAFLPDTDGRQIVPLNMGAPIQVVRGQTTATNLGFAPHGAGRNLSRSAHIRRQDGRSEAEIFAAETQGLDVRFYSGIVDISELPSAYKSAASVAAQMRQFDLATVVDEIAPHGSIMAGDWQRDAPWRKMLAAKGASA